MLFQVLSNVLASAAGADADVELQHPAVWERELAMVHPALLDGALQLLVVRGESAERARRDCSSLQVL